MGPFHAAGFGSVPGSAEAHPGVCIFLLYSVLKSQRRGKERGQNSSPEHLSTALCLPRSGTGCSGVCGGGVCLGFSSFGCLTCLAVNS